MRLRITDVMPEAEADSLAGVFLGDQHYDRLVGEDAEVLKPDGTPLAIFRKSVLSATVCRAAWENLRNAASTESNNRGYASGRVPGGGVRTKRRKKDGTLSRTDVAVGAGTAKTGIVGYYDRYDRIPYCRQTAFNLDRPARFTAALPFIRAVDAVFAREAPERHAAQKAVIARTHRDFYIQGTAFTTITVNRNWQTATHKDQGDYQLGFGVMSVLQAGRYDGGFLVFPRYRVAFDMRSQDVLLADVHEWHGNTPIVGKPGQFERISCVFYYRANMYRCGSASEELDRAKNRRRGQPLWD